MFTFVHLQHIKWLHGWNEFSFTFYLDYYWCDGHHLQIIHLIYLFQWDLHLIININLIIIHQHHTFQLMIPMIFPWLNMLINHHQLVKAALVQQHIDIDLTSMKMIKISIQVIIDQLMLPPSFHSFIHLLSLSFISVQPFTRTRWQLSRTISSLSQ